MAITKNLATGITLQLNDEGGNKSCVVSYDVKKLLNGRDSDNTKFLLINLLTETSGELLLDGFGVKISEVKDLKNGIGDFVSKLIFKPTSIPIEYRYIGNEDNLEILVGGELVSKVKVSRDKVEKLNLNFLKEQAKGIVSTLKIG